MGGTSEAAKSVVTEFLARLNARGDAAALLSGAAVVTVNGTTPLSGRYTGLAMVRGILVDTARDVIASLDVEIDRLIGTGSRIAALLRLSGSTRAGAIFNAERRCCGAVFGVADGLIDEIILYPDTSLIEIALYRRRFVSNA